MATSSSSSSTAGRWTYDVFLSFRGEDTRNNFVDHLYAALDRVGIYTFKDDEKLQRGKSISPELTKAIEESVVAVVVFSKNYANSSWCLEELAKIIECRNLIGQWVLPVFYDVDPSDVCKQKGSFHEAFGQHEVNFIDDMEKVKRWREALNTAANLSGWDVSRIASGREAECIKQIVQNILRHTESHPTENLIGMESRVRHVKSLLGKSADDVCMIGIWGMGGIGKTTIARAVYYQISYEFEGCSFMEDVRENGSDKRGLKSLQEKLLSEILLEDLKVKDCDDGMYQIRRRLSRKKVLVVLDDVDNITQLEFLAGAHEWFGSGSRIIVTTRDKHVLCYAQEKYEPELLKETEAMKLFSRYAFKANIPPKEYKKVSGLVVSHTGHLPLALKVLGSHFCGRNLDFWESGLNVLAKIPQKEINRTLKLSFDGLNILEKKIFLEIACFFKGRERRHVTRILDSFDLEAVSGITVLIERSLLTSLNGCLHMHDLVQEMGRCIVRECYPNNMVWVLEEIKEVMTTITRLKMVEAIVDTTHYHFSDMPMVCCHAEVFKSMKKLRLLEVKGKFTSSEPKRFPEQLRWLSWYLYPFQSLRITGGMAKLVGLEMQSSEMEKLQIENKVILPNLKSIDLSFSGSIKSFPDISGVPNLELLDLSFCSDLVEVHQSVLLHERIIQLYLSSCDSLESLPSRILMKSLQSLHRNGCGRLKGFPQVSGEMGSLLVLNIDGCNSLRPLPPSIQLLTGLVILTMANYSEMELKPELEELLNSLGLSRNNLIQPFTSVSHLSHLKYLNLSCCINLQKLPELPSVIQVLRADHCTSLREIGDLSKNTWLFKISLCSCPKLPKAEVSDSHLANLLMKSLVQKCAAVNHQLSITLPGETIPYWFRNKQLGDKIALNLPQNQMLGLALCCNFWLYPSHELDAHLKIKFKSSVKDKLTDRSKKFQHVPDHVWMGYMPIDIIQNLCRGFDTEDLVISFKCKGRASIMECGAWVKGSASIMECGAWVVYKDDIKPMSGIQSWIPDHVEFGSINHDGVCMEDLQKRWFKRTFLVGNGKTGDNTVHIHL